MKTIRLLFLLFLLTALTACGGSEPPAPPEGPETVSLTVWGAEEDQELLQEILTSFQARYAEEANFQITCQPQSESSCKDAILGDLEAGPDVFAFADDQVSALAAAGALDPIPDPEAVRSASLSAAVEAASVENTLYAYPLTADNGYFLYYNKAYLTEEDVQSLDRILSVAASSGRKFVMDWTSAWYVYAFFGNTGLEVGLNPDGLTNYCTWNGTGTVSGVDVAQAMLSIAASPGFANRTDTEFLEGVRNGTVIAGVSGVWNAVAVQEAWGENAGAAKLPTYTCGGGQIQMASFSGCKLVGVNAYSKEPEWAARLAEWIASEENQRLRFGSGSGQQRGGGFGGGPEFPGNRGASGTVGILPAPAGGREVLGPGGGIRVLHGAGESVRGVPSGPAGPYG